MPFLKLREYLNRQPALGWACGAALICIAVAYGIWAMKSDSSARADFFDEDTNQPVVRSIREVPPLIGKHGNASVFAPTTSAMSQPARTAENSLISRSTVTREKRKWNGC